MPTVRKKKPRKASGPERQLWQMLTEARLGFDLVRDHPFRPPNRYRSMVLAMDPIKREKFLNRKRPKNRNKGLHNAVRIFAFDIALLEVKLAIEIEGGSFVMGAHTRGPGFEDDCVKYNEAVIYGWRVLRVTPRMIRNGSALEYIKMALGAKTVNEVRATPEQLSFSP